MQLSSNFHTKNKHWICWIICNWNFPKKKPIVPVTDFRCEIVFHLPTFCHFFEKNLVGIPNAHADAFHRPLEPAGEPLVAPNRRSCLFQTCGRRRLANGTLCSILRTWNSDWRRRPLSHGSKWPCHSLVCLMMFDDFPRPWALPVAVLCSSAFRPYCFGSRFLRSATRSWQPFHASISKIPNPSHVRASCPASERCGGNVWLLAISIKSSSNTSTKKMSHPDCPKGSFQLSKHINSQYRILDPFATLVLLGSSQFM